MSLSSDTLFMHAMHTMKRLRFCSWLCHNTDPDVAYMGIRSDLCEQSSGLVGAVLLEAQSKEMGRASPGQGRLENVRDREQDALPRLHERKPRLLERVCRVGRLALGGRHAGDAARPAAHVFLGHWNSGRWERAGCGRARMHVLPGHRPTGSQRRSSAGIGSPAAAWMSSGVPRVPASARSVGPRIQSNSQEFLTTLHASSLVPCVPQRSGRSDAILYPPPGSDRSGVWGEHRLRLRRVCSWQAYLCRVWQGVRGYREGGQ